MARRKRKNEDLIDMLYEITEVFWQVGAVITVICTIGTLYSLESNHKLLHTANFAYFSNSA